MKTFIAIVVAAAVGFAVAYVLVAQRKTREFQRERAESADRWAAEKDRLARELKAARNAPARVEPATRTERVTVTSQVSAEEILDKLLRMKPGASEPARYQSLRQIIHQLESLVDLGATALPAIRGFVARNQDISYERERESAEPGGTAAGGAAPGGSGGAEGPSPFSTPPPPRTDYYHPYSLRLGLFDVVRRIGGRQAEQILAGALSTTARAVEVAHLDKLLDEMAPGKYGAEVVSAAKELLTRPIASPNPTRLDQAAKSFLYAILARHNDTSFLPAARSLLVGADGQLDRYALAYVTRIERDQAVPTLYQLYKDVRLTNVNEKMLVVNAALNFAGVNAQANQLLTEVVVTPPDLGGRGRFMPYMALGQLDHGDLAPSVIQGRQALLNSLKASVQDQRILAMIDRVNQSLQRKLDSKSAAPDRGPARDRVSP